MLGGKKTSAVWEVGVAVIRYTHIVNFTDFLLLEEAATFEDVQPGTDFNSYDTVILPITKNTVSDRVSFWPSGAAESDTAYAKTNLAVIGGRSGYQMIGDHDI